MRRNSANGDLLGLIAAGFETVSTTFTNSAFLLLQRPDLMAQLKERRDDPARMASAIEEILRMTPIGLGRPRIARGEVTLSGTTVNPGEVMMLDILSANRDELVFPHAKEVNFDREANPMISFGRGFMPASGNRSRAWNCGSCGARCSNGCLRSAWLFPLKRCPGDRTRQRHLARLIYR